MKTEILDTTETTSQELIKEALQKAITYPEYRDLVHKLATTHKTTGPIQTEALIKYTQLNDKRMKRWDKTFKIDALSTESIKKTALKTTWLVITESWCGDAAPALPVMQKIAQLNPNISLKIVLRDQNLALMNRFLTNGGMGIPKLIAVNDQTDAIVTTWGPRSTNATNLVQAHKTEHGAVTPKFKEELQVWYNKDKGQSILKDLLTVLLLE